jgi:hypothetical protein
MKIVILLLCLYPVCYADSIQKIWQVTPENDIVSVEDIPVETSGFSNESDVLSDSVSENSLEDLPLAKTFPLKETAVTSRQNSISEVKESVKKGTMQERISQIQHAIEKETQKKETEQKTERNTNVVAHETNIKNAFSEIKSITEKNLRQEDVVDSERVVHTEHKSIYLKLLEHIPSVHIREFYIAGSFLLLFIMFAIFFSRKKGHNKFQKQEPHSFEQEWSKKFDRYFTLKGEVHQQFLIRKQNILFNNDFTQYQKAKALLELEKEYTDLEYIYLPKLFGNDFNAFIDAEKVLSSKPELREMIQEFVEETLEERAFTKIEREHILRNVKHGYRTSHYNWQFDEIAMQASTSKREEQGAYFLQ